MTTQPQLPQKPILLALIPGALTDQDAEELAATIRALATADASGDDNSTTADPSDSAVVE